MSDQAIQNCPNCGGHHPITACSYALTSSFAAPSGSAERPATIAYEMYANVRHQHDLRVAEIGSLKAKLEYIAYSGLSARHLADYAKSALEEKDSAAMPNVKISDQTVENQKL